MTHRCQATVLAVLLGALLGALLAPIAPAVASTIDDPSQRLEAAGVVPSQFIVQLAWSEWAPEAEVLVHGYRLEPLDGSPPFDFYLDDDGVPLDEDALAALGIAPKRWGSLESSAAFQRREESGAKALPAPEPAALRHGLAPAAEWALPPLDPAAVKEQRDEVALEKGPHFVGVVRDADISITMSGGVPAVGEWAEAPSGNLGWALQVHDPGAEGIRLQLTGVELPASARVVVYDAYAPQSALAVHARGHEIWTPAIFSDTVVLEIEVDALDAAAVSFQLIASGHLTEDFTLLAESKRAGACNIDVTCHPDYQDVADAVGLYSFVRGSSMLTCTGALMADTDPETQIPYFMTANHCVSSQTAVSSMEIYWFFQTAVCNGTPPSLNSLPRSDSGADLLSTSTRAAGTDHTLVRLHGELPEGVTFLGWDGIPAPFGLEVAGVHHPRSSFKRIAFGPITDCTAQSNYSCPSSVNLDRFYEVTWHSGVTEPGSSGSPIVNAENKAFLGALWGGFAACGSGIMADYYGRVEVTLPMVLQWLDPTPPAVVISTNNGENFKTRFPDIALAGTVDTAATMVTVNGSISGVNYVPNNSIWSFSGVLSEGPNPFVVAAHINGSTSAASITVTLDTNPPVITLNGTDPDFVVLGGEYEDPGATAEDPEEGPVEVTVTGTVANEPVGAESILEYSASDSVGNTAVVTRTVIVSPGPDSAPVLVITTDGGNGPGADYDTANPALLLEGVTSDNAVSLTVNGSSEGVSFEPGDAEWQFEGELEEGANSFVVVVASGGGLETSASIEITLDSIPPVITLFGDNPDTVFLGEVYEDPGAEAVDERDGPVEVTVSGTVVSEPEGAESILTYRAEDAVGNVAEETRTVIAVVNPDEPPKVKITTNNGANFFIAETSVMINGTTTSNTDTIRVNGSSVGVNYVPGATVWSYNAILAEGPNSFVVIGTGPGGASSPVGITITSDTVPPVITLNGNNPDTVELGGIYKDPGATAMDAISGPVSVTVSGFVVNTPLGATSTLTYRATDPAGNQATATRTVVVAPAFSQPPTLSITTNGGNGFLTNNPELVLEGAVSTNATEVIVNGETTGVVFAPLDTAWRFETVLTGGANTFEVQATGPGGSSTVRTITVTLDANPPVITLAGNNPTVIPLGGPYIEPGAQALDPEDGVVPVTVTGAVALEPIGAASTRVYRAQDSAGNVTLVTRTVIVGDPGDFARVRLGSAVAPRNGLLTIPIVLLPNGEPIASLDITVQYNNAVIRFERFDPGPAAEFSGASLQATALGGGRVRLRVTGNQQNGGELVPGVVGRLVMGRSTEALPASTPLSAVQGAGATVEGKALTVQIDPAIAHYLSGTLGPDTDGDGLSDAAELLLGTDPNAFDTNGNGYSDGFEIANGSNPLDPDTTPIPLPIVGDVNIDGQVDSVDVQLVINGALGLQTPMPTDITGDGATSAVDVQQVINAALGLAG